ncbi:hypothetical protein QE152_g9381 [Popillia japonica]|uniref:Uncharacterized protein n=1 Tax=Popillia japonica TaxID=7064 RepID=A0AAW1LZH0_POPJA
MVSDTPTDAEILDSITNVTENLDLSSLEEENMDVPQQADIQRALSVLHSALERNENVPDSVFTNLQKVEAYFDQQIYSTVLKQLKISDFFKPQ